MFLLCQNVSRTFFFSATDILSTKYFEVCTFQCRLERPESVLTACVCLPLRLCRLKKKAQGEVNATAISNLLPFVEYELHTQLMNKLKLRSMNALFGLHIQISVGENMLLGLAVGFVFCFFPGRSGASRATFVRGEGWGGWGAFCHNEALTCVCVHVSCVFSRPQGCS